MPGQTTSSKADIQIVVIYILLTLACKVSIRYFSYGSFCHSNKFLYTSWL